MDYSQKKYSKVWIQLSEILANLNNLATTDWSKANGSVQVPLNPARSASFFIQNSVFLSQIPPAFLQTIQIPPSEQAQYFSSLGNLGLRMSIGKHDPHARGHTGEEFVGPNLDYCMTMHLG